MIALAESENYWPYGTTTIINSGATGTATITYSTEPNSTATSAWRAQRSLYTVISYDGRVNDRVTEFVHELELEPLWRRRWRLSLEAIERFRRAARRLRLRITNQWHRPVTVARVCAQSERWRVLA